jgi:hypothetical protein
VLNKENLDKLMAKLLEIVHDDPYAFTMGTWVRKSDRASCGTAACIAGWIGILTDTVQIYETSDKADAFQWVDRFEAGDWLGLNGPQINELFTPPWDECYEATAADALIVLRGLRDTGIVDWTEARENIRHRRAAEHEMLYGRNP